MMIDALFVDKWIILDDTAPVHSVTAVMNLAILHRTPHQDTSIRNTLPPRMVSINAIIYPHLKGQVTPHLPWAQTWETSPLITITPPFPPQQEQQQLQKSHIVHPIKPPQSVVPPFG